MNSTIKKLRIVQIPEWDSKRKVVVFFSIFGFLWLVLEPLFAFVGNTGLLSRLGVFGYIALWVASGVGMMIAEAYSAGRQSNYKVFIPFEVVLLESGERYPVEAPGDMLVANFVNMFLERVSQKKSTVSITVGSQKLYDNELMIKVDDAFERIPGEYTLKEAGVEENAECRIIGEIKPEYEHINYLHPLALILAIVLAAVVLSKLLDITSAFLDK